MTRVLRGCIRCIMPGCRAEALRVTNMSGSATLTTRIAKPSPARSWRRYVRLRVFWRIHPSTFISYFPVSRPHGLWLHAISGSLTWCYILLVWTRGTVSSTQSASIQVYDASSRRTHHTFRTILGRFLTGHSPTAFWIAYLLQTIVCIPLMGGVLELGTTDSVCNNRQQCAHSVLNNCCPLVLSDQAWICCLGSCKP